MLTIACLSSDNELLSILEMNLRSNEVEATLSFREKAIDVLRVQRKMLNFGNAGSVELLVRGAALKASKRVGGSATSLILQDSDIVDPGAARAEKDEDPLLQLDKLYRMDKIKAKLDKMRKNLEVQRREGGEEPELGHFVFLGSPGESLNFLSCMVSLFGAQAWPLNLPRAIALS